MANSASYADRELNISKQLGYPRELVYKSWIDLRTSLKWWGSTEYVATHAQIDLRPGGAWSGRFRKMSNGRECRCVGIVHEIVPPARIIYTYSWEEHGDRGPDTLVTLSFAEVTAFRTKVTMHQRPFRTRGERDGYRSAWEETLDRFGLCLDEEQHLVTLAGAQLAAE
jgi:uncharacterized protein YndB with AHSA1/START domain